MSLNSVNTNMGAMVALQSLNTTQTQLAATQKQISTGFRVADSTDDGAAFAIAQGVRSSVSALTTANQQLGNVIGLLQTTQAGLTNISNTMNSMRDVLVKLTDASTTTTQRANYVQQYGSMLKNIQTDIQDASYNGKSLISNIAGSNSTAASVAVTRNENGATYGVASMGASAAYHGISFTSTQLGSAASVAALVTGGGVFITQQTAIGKNLNTVGSAINFVNNQTTYNNDKISALNVGLGSLVDADLAKESAQLTALNIRQQLGTQALSLANQAPQSLLSLFK